MKTKKMSLANIKGKLSRAEMKNIMAGSGGGGGAVCNCFSPMCGERNGYKVTCYSPTVCC